MEKPSLVLVKGADFFKYMLLPLLLSSYPAFFHYGNNLASAFPSDLWKLLLLFGVPAILVYVFCIIILRQLLQASLATCAFMAVFHTYGLLFRLLRGWDILRVEHYSILPVVIALPIYMGWVSLRWNHQALTRLWRGALLILVFLIGFNVITILWSQIRTVAARQQAENFTVPAFDSNNVDRRPDIYYFVYDEMAGFQAMRDYWHNDDVDTLVDFLKGRGFYVAERSHGSSIDTQVELATRLNYQQYSVETGTSRLFQEAMADNRAVNYLKSLGYTTIAFDEIREPIAYPAAPPMKVDILYEHPAGSVRGMQQGFFNDLILLASDNTMLSPFLDDVKLQSPVAAAQFHRDMLFFTMDRVTTLDNVPGPKFVYIHVMLPHMPFMFKADGSLNSEGGYYNWESYLGNYQFAEALIQKTVTQILANAGPHNPPVIIISSDHGARNKQVGKEPTLPDYPDAFQTLIVNALFLPGCDRSVLAQDMNPINTLPIVFNCYFDAHIPLQ